MNNKRNRQEQQGGPPRQGMYDPRFEHDACGIGMLVNIQGEKSHAIAQRLRPELDRIGERHNARIKVVEIAPSVIAAARQFFKLPAEDARFSIHIGCGAQYVMEKDQYYDYILVDGYDRNARAGALDTLPFYQALQSRLSARGLMAVNLFGRSRGYKASVERVLKAFDGRALAFPSCDSGNVVAFGAAGEAVERALSELRERAQILKLASDLDLAPTITRLEQSGSVPGGVLHL